MSHKIEEADTMPTWHDLSALSTSSVQRPWTSAPRNLAEQADRVMKLLELRPAPIQRVGPTSRPVGQPTWIATSTGHDSSKVSFPAMADLGPRPMASPTLALQVGRAGLAALQALGAAGAAALTAILNSYRNRLGRLPTPQELDAALSAQASPNRETHSPPNSATEDSDASKKRREEECEDLFASD